MNRDEIMQGVVESIRETLALGDDEQVEPEHLLFYDLEFSSLDLLDLMFRLEEHFGITIKEGTLERLARGDLPEAEFAVDGVLTERGRKGLMALLEDTPEEVFQQQIRTATLPRYATVAAMARLVEHRLGEGDADV